MPNDQRFAKTLDYFYTMERNVAEFRRKWVREEMGLRLDQSTAKQAIAVLRFLNSDGASCQIIADWLHRAGVKLEQSRRDLAGRVLNAAKANSRLIVDKHNDRVTLFLRLEKDEDNTE